MSSISTAMIFASSTEAPWVCETKSQLRSLIISRMDTSEFSVKVVRRKVTSTVVFFMGEL